MIESILNPSSLTKWRKVLESPNDYEVWTDRYSWQVHRKGNNARLFAFTAPYHDHMDIMGQLKRLCIDCRTQHGVH